jgi:hypothetical protein
VQWCTSCLSQSNGLCDACMPTNSLCVVNVVFVFVFVCLRERERVNERVRMCPPPLRPLGMDYLLTLMPYTCSSVLCVCGVRCACALVCLRVLLWSTVVWCLLVHGACVCHVHVCLLPSCLARACDEWWRLTNLVFDIVGICMSRDTAEHGPANRQGCHCRCVQR